MSAVPFSHLPSPYGTIQRITYLVAYLLVALFGLASLTLTPMTIAGALGEQTVYVWAVLATIGGFGGALACAIRRSHVELVSTPLAIGGFGGYLAAVWSLVDSETVTRSPQALALTVLVLVWVARLVEVFAAVIRGRRRVEQRKRSIQARGE